MRSRSSYGKASKLKMRLGEKIYEEDKQIVEDDELDNEIIEKILDDNAHI